MKKKLVSLLLCAAMVVTMIAGSALSVSAEEPIKIGVSIWSSTDVLGSQCKLILDAAAEALGVEVIYVDQGHVSEQVTGSVETLAAAGCQGIIICNSASSEMASCIATAQANGVYLAQFFRYINEEADPDVYALATASPYYVGAVHENEPENGATLMNILLERGCRDIGLIGWEQGDATFLGRWAGYKAGIEAWNEANPDDQAVLSEPQYAGTTSEGGAKAANALMSADPNIQALIPAGGGGEPLLGTLSAIEAAGKVGEIAVVSTDFLPDLKERLENGSMTGESGGHYCDPLIAFMMVYNAITGNYTGFEGVYNDVLFPYLYVSSAEDYAAYETYFVDQLPYTAEELVAMSQLSLEELKETAANISIEDAAARSAAR